MRVICLFIISVFLLACEGKRDLPEDKDFEKFLLTIAENFRKQMPTGIPALQLPPVEPLNIKKFEVNVNEDAAKLDLKFENVVVTGLSKFKIESLKSNLQYLYLDINITMPSITITGNYSVNGLAVSIIPLTGSGPFSFKLGGLNVWAHGILQPGSPIKFTKLKFDAGFGSIHLDFKNLLGGGAWITWIQQVGSLIGPVIFKAAKSKIMPPLQEFAITEVNKVFANNPAIKNLFGGMGY